MGFFEDVVCIRPKAHGLSGNGELPPQFDAATTTHDHHGSDEGEGQDSMAVNESDGSSGARHHGMEDHCAEATGHTARRGQDGSNTNVSGANKENCLPGQELAEIRLAQEAMDGFQRGISERE
ncbi:hypothetical protein K504DRAFT_505282 [Pleomassaria siparia CBS 279.74]|uniref:Uncharacterized protein n=1 Tax=Pleomassaria siparia CBS 279.74 TaxID=1314801 RepID=A0A6G1K1E4_9PLEO|nr:hypothetical protein K504DRAFT_505282 [Pleomassaria siparia CBS 279.74]